MLDALFLSELDLLLLLAVLQMGEQAYGVPLTKEAGRQRGRSLAAGGVYAALNRLEERGLVRSRLGEPTAARGGRAKRFFEVTDAGFGALRHMRALLNELPVTLPASPAGDAV